MRYLILVNSGIFLCDLLFHLELWTFLGLTPAHFWIGAFWQPLTYMFLHGGIFHLLFNMLVLWMFGTALELTWGAPRFFKFYLVCGIGAGLLNAVLTPGGQIPIVGSSGAIYGLLMAFAILFPEQIIYFWGIFPLKAKYFVIGIGIIEFLMAVSTTERGIAHIAHLGGMLFGLVYIKWKDWRGAVAGWQDEQKHKRHLKLDWNRNQEKQKLQDEIDRLLDKIGKIGSGYLTEGEHQLLKKMSKRMEELGNKE